MLILKCKQGEEAWVIAKLGKPSASNASKIVTNAGVESKQRTAYLHELCAERITGRKEESYKNANMEMGNEREQESRELYQLLNDVSVEQVGVIYKDESKQILCSPDGIVDGKSGLELKNPLPKTQVKYLLDGKLPSVYFSQVQFSLYVTGFEYWDFMSYVPAMPVLKLRVARDEKFISALESELDKFCNELDEITNKLKGESK